MQIMTTSQTGATNTTWNITSCKGCGEKFEARSSRQHYCSRECQHRATNNNARANKRADGYRYFYGIDGETGGPNQAYQLLGCGNDDTYSYVYAEQGLGWEEIFQFLWGCFEKDHREHTVYAGFFLRFDFSQWFKTWPEDRARLLFTTGGKLVRTNRSNPRAGTYPVWITGKYSKWEVNGIGERMIRIRKKGAAIRQYMAINDSGPFFQSSLVNTIAPQHWAEAPICTQEEFDKIVEGKSKRGRDKTPANDPGELEYNRLENAVLCRLLARYNEGLSAIGIHLGIHQWFGPGQAAQEWFKNIGLPDKEVNHDCLRGFWDVCIESYYGGWFEIFMHGTIPGITFEYDINSAYPYIMSTLPCMVCGSWRKGTGKPPDRKGNYVLIRGRVAGSNNHVGSMLHRNCQGNGISRPLVTKGVYWLHELAAAKNAGLVDSWEIEEWYEYFTPCSHKPLAGVASLYNERNRVGKDTAHGKAMKLIYNSGYGKLTQSVGGAKFANPMYASLITAGCRVLILNAIASHPEGTDDLVMVATDAVFFRSRHDKLRISKALGEWGEETHENLRVFKPGHYWNDRARRDIAIGKHPKFKARGVSARDFAAVIEQTTRKMDQFPKWVQMFSGHVPASFWPRVSYTTSFAVVTIGQALAWNRWEDCGKILQDVPLAKLTSVPLAKRDAPKAYYDSRYGVARTPPYRRAWHKTHSEMQSTPYEHRFGFEHEEDTTLSEIWTEEGPGAMLAMDAIGLGRLHETGREEIRYGREA